MKWEGGRRSSNVEDRRAMGGAARAGGGMGCLGIVVAIVYMLLGGDPRTAMDIVEATNPGGGGTTQGGGGGAPAPEEDRLAQFVSVVLADTEEVWGQLLPASGTAYREPVLVLFRGSVDSACGRAGASMGPFYCPGDSKVYIDLSFYDELQRRFGAPGDFAQAYVIAHEIGHHVQNLLGTSAKVHRMEQAAGSEAEANAWSVRLELQADCLAGVWAHHADKQRHLLEEGDVEEALNAARAIGDDTLQKQSRGRVVPDSFTHGSAEQRMRWFRTGLKAGAVASCDTFASGNP